MTKNETLELFKSFSEGTQKGLYKIVDKLEQRIAKLEKVLESHAKCIGEMRDKDDLKDMPEEVLVKTWEEKTDV